MKKVLIWDFDGTLGYRDGWWRGCLTDVLQSVDSSISVTPEEISVFLQEGFPWHNPENGHTHIKSADQWWEAFEPLLVRAYKGVGVDEVKSQHCASRVRAEYVNPEKWHLFDDVVPTLMKLHDQEWIFFVASNHVPELPYLLSRLGLADYFQDVFTSALVGYEKPHPKFFEHALLHIGDCDEMWFVGDNFNADIVGSSNAGIKNVLVRNEHADALFCSEGLAGVESIVSS